MKAATNSTVEAQLLPPADIDPAKQAEFQELCRKAGAMLANQEAQGCMLYAFELDGKGIETEFANHAPPKMVSAIGYMIGQTIESSPFAAAPIVTGILKGKESVIAERKKAKADPNTVVQDEDDIDNFIHNN